MDGESEIRKHWKRLFDDLAAQGYSDKDALKVVDTVVNGRVPPWQPSVDGSDIVFQRSWGEEDSGKVRFPITDFLSSPPLTRAAVAARMYEASDRDACPECGRQVAVESHDDVPTPNRTEFANCVDCGISLTRKQGRRWRRS
jgi:hypothetical protein